MEAVCITGIGATTPLGHSYEAIADALIAGRSATRLLVEEQAGQQVKSITSLVDEVPLAPGYDAAAWSARPKLERMALWSVGAALRDAQLYDRRQQLRIGLVVGQASEWYRHWRHDHASGGNRVCQPELDGQTLASIIQSELQIFGPSSSVGAACASANYAFALARRWVELGIVDVCIAGSSEIACPITRANFANLRALSRRFDAPERAARPFDLERDGFVMGEGAAMFVLERTSSARRRGVRNYAQIAGFGASSDASHMIIPCEDPQPAAAAMRAALADAQVEPSDLGYVNAHATGTPVGDRAEARALGMVLGPHKMRTPVSSTKSMTGHLVSAAAAVEAIACIAALDRQLIPPTINLDQPDPDCDILHVPGRAIAHKVDVALSNSFGFGGSNTSLVLRKAC